MCAILKLNEMLEIFFTYNKDTRLQSACAHAVCLCVGAFVFMYQHLNVRKCALLCKYLRQIRVQMEVHMCLANNLHNGIF